MPVRGTTSPLIDSTSNLAKQLSRSTTTAHAEMCCWAGMGLRMVMFNVTSDNETDLADETDDLREDSLLLPLAVHRADG